MTTRTRRPRRRLDLADYGERVDAFLAQVNEATYRQLAGLGEEMGLEAIYAEHRALFEPAVIDGLRAASEGDAEAAAEARALLGFAVAGHVAAAVSDLTDAVETAQARAIVVWRGERMPYRDVWNRATDIAHRAERNALARSYYDAVEAINPLRQERFERMAEAVRALGYADTSDMVRRTAGFDPEELAADQRAFLADSETSYFAALRRFLAEIDIEHGDASRVDLARCPRCAGRWPAWASTSTRSAPSPSTSSGAMGSRRAPSARRSTSQTTCASSSSREGAGTTTPPRSTKPAMPSTSPTWPGTCRSPSAASATTA